MAENKLRILHLLSWAPTTDNPTLGNFCFRHINSLPDFCESIILQVTTTDSVAPSFHIEYDHHVTYLKWEVRNCRNKWLRKWHIWQGYQQGYAYIDENLGKPDLVHLHVTLPMGRVALFWKYRRHLPYVITEHWTAYQPQNRKNFTLSQICLAKQVAKHASKVLPVSQDLANNMQQCGLKANYHVIFNVVDTSIFTTKIKNRNSKKQILHISTLRDDAKNFSGILRMIETLSKQRNDFVLNVIHDYEAPQFKLFVAEHGLSDVVIFHGQKNTREIAEFYRQSDFLLLFSNFENLPCVIVEAFASGLPVLSSQVGGIGEIVNHERGILIPARDETQLLISTNYLLDHADDFSAEDIRQYAESHFSPKVIGHQIALVYQEVCKKQMKPLSVSE